MAGQERDIFLGRGRFFDDIEAMPASARQKGWDERVSIEASSSDTKQYSRKTWKQPDEKSKPGYRETTIKGNKSPATSGRLSRQYKHLIESRVRHRQHRSLRLVLCLLWIGDWILLEYMVKGEGSVYSVLHTGTLYLTPSLSCSHLSRAFAHENPRYFLRANSSYHLSTRRASPLPSTPPHPQSLTKPPIPSSPFQNHKEEKRGATTGSPTQDVPPDPTHPPLAPPRLRALGAPDNLHRPPPRHHHLDPRRPSRAGILQPRNRHPHL
jgi:hypothetical protein